MDVRAVAAEMTFAAGELLAGLASDTSRPARLAADDPSRTDWAFYPREMAGQRPVGVALHQLDVGGRKLVHRLLESGLSYHAYAQVASIMAMELVVDLKEGHRITDLRDPARYWVAIYGDPSPTGRWSWRFEGHHVSVHHLVEDGAVTASTPLFLGSNPAEVRHGGHVVLRPCGEEEDAGRALLRALDSERRAVAVLHSQAPIDTIVVNQPYVPRSASPGDPPHPLEALQNGYAALTDRGRASLRFERDRPGGLAAADMDDEQLGLLSALLDVYLDRLPEPLAAAQRHRIEGAGIGDIHFGWAGSERPGEPHYYRLHGPVTLIEYDRVQDDANHVHAVWRDLDRDFGGDPDAGPRAAG